MANQHAYLYDAATLVLDKEVISYRNGLSRTLDRSQDNLLRPSGFQLMNGTTEEHATSYGYDTAGRLAGVHTAAAYSATPDFSYNYLANSGSLVESVTSPAHTVSNSYETTRNVLDVKSNATNGANPSVVSAFDYSVNNLGQRDDVSRTGSAFTSANTETWNYNAKGEVVTANHSTNNAFDRSFEFDGIGNRKKSADSITLPAVNNYSANTLNQLTTVNGGARIHDADGNLIDDGTKFFVWDAENRLIEIKLKSDNSTVATYAYDYQSRRITKTVGATETNFVYDGWNPIAEYTSALSPLSFTLSTSYTWGMDLSGSMQGAGGVGGLLSVNDGSDSFYPTFDGNGNVSEYVDATGVVVAHYEYDAFGQVVASGSKKDDFTHQFSTKQLDSESGLHYYGYRYYDSSNGRWPSRDPIEEDGGLNLYGFVSNDPTNRWDILGLDEIDEHGYRRSKEAYEKTISTMNQGITDAMKHWTKLAYKAGITPNNNFMREYGGIICCNGKSGEVKSSEPHAGILTGPIRTVKGWEITGYDENFREMEDRRGKGGGINPFYDLINKEKVNCKKLFGEDYKLVATYHSHPPGDTSLSGSDKRNARDRNARNYVGSNRDLDKTTDNFEVNVFEPDINTPVTPDNKFPGTKRPVSPPKN